MPIWSVDGIVYTVVAPGNDLVPAVLFTMRQAGCECEPLRWADEDDTLTIFHDTGCVVAQHFGTGPPER